MPTRTYECEECNASFTRRSEGRDAGRFCSRACGYAGQRKKAAIIKQNNEKKRQLRLGDLAYRMMQQVALRIALEGIKKREVIASRSSVLCKTCQEPVQYTHGGRPRKSCDPCRNREGKRRERSKHRAKMKLVHSLPYSRVDVFNRFNWSCYICGMDTPRELMGKNSNLSNEPTIDHIIPIARGGHDVYDNLALACRACNTTKSDKTYIEYMGYDEEDWLETG